MTTIMANTGLTLKGRTAPEKPTTEGAKALRLEKSQEREEPSEKKEKGEPSVAEQINALEKGLISEKMLSERAFALRTLP